MKLYYQRQATIINFLNLIKETNPINKTAKLKKRFFASVEFENLVIVSNKLLIHKFIF